MRGVSSLLLILASSGGRGRVAAFVSPQISTIRTHTYLQETVNTQPIDKEEEVSEVEGHHHKKKKKYVVIGAGWGGWGAGKSLCESVGKNA